MFGKFLGALKPTKLDDAYFGPLLFMKAGRGRQSYWEGARLFKPLQKRVEVFIDAVSRDEPTSEAQRDFFRQVERDYGSICSMAEERFRADSWAQRLLAERFEDAFSLSSLSIPLCQSPDEEWSITFDAAADEDHLFTLNFRGREPSSVSIDG